MVTLDFSECKTVSDVEKVINKDSDKFKAIKKVSGEFEELKRSNKTTKDGN